MAQSARKTNEARTGRKAAAGKTMAEAVTSAAESVEDVGRDMARRVGRSARNAREAALEKADEARNALSETGERLSERLRQAASHASGVAQEIPAKVSEQLSDTAARLRGGPVGEIAADLRHMARRNPGVFMAGAALAGFALARLLSSRTDRND